MRLFVCLCLLSPCSKTLKRPYFRPFQPDTQILSALTAFIDLVQPSTDPVPPSTNQIVWWLVLYSWSCLSKIISYGFLLCSTVIGLDLESHSREKVQFFETRLRIIFLALAWRDEIEIIIWPFSYFETRTRFHYVTLMFRDEIETSENHFSWSSEKKWSWLSSRIPGIENSHWPLFCNKHPLMEKKR